jgi:hypothetical protein
MRSATAFEKPLISRRPRRTAPASSMRLSQSLAVTSGGKTLTPWRRAS